MIWAGRGRPRRGRGGPVNTARPHPGAAPAQEQACFKFSSLGFNIIVILDCANAQLLWINALLICPARTSGATGTVQCSSAPPVPDCAMQFYAPERQGDGAVQPCPVLPTPALSTLLCLGRVCPTLVALFCSACSGLIVISVVKWRSTGLVANAMHSVPVCHPMQAYEGAQDYAGYGEHNLHHVAPFCSVSTLCSMVA